VKGLKSWNCKVKRWGILGRKCLLGIVRVLVTTVRFWYAEETVTYTKQSKKCADARPLPTCELELTDFITFCRVLLFPAKFIDKSIDALCETKDKS
jgi:hypothetical protein